MDNTIGYNVEVVLKGFNGNKPVPAKVDTGADLNSLHANNVEVTGKTVSFEFGNKRITMPLSAHQSVRSADGGVEQRPVVKFNVEVPKDGTDKDVLLNNLEFTLNDRTHMADKILLGKNFIEQGKFSIVSDLDSPKDIVETTITDYSQREIISNLLEVINANGITLEQLVTFK